MRARRLYLTVLMAHFLGTMYESEARSNFLERGTAWAVGAGKTMEKKAHGLQRMHAVLSLTNVRPRTYVPTSKSNFPETLCTQVTTAASLLPRVAHARRSPGRSASPGCGCRWKVASGRPQAHDQPQR